MLLKSLQMTNWVGAGSMLVGQMHYLPHLLPLGQCTTFFWISLENIQQVVFMQPFSWTPASSCLA